MIRSILVALDESKASRFAEKFAVHMAEQCKASITGIGVLDELWMIAPEAVPIGGAGFKAELDADVLADAKRRIHRLESDFSKLCQATQCAYEVIDAIGIPSDQICRHLTDHDILVVGKDADFHFIPTMGPSAPVEELMKHNPRPLILTGTADLKGEDVLVAFDGTRASSKALHMALLMGFLKKSKTHIITVAHTSDEAEAIMRPALSLCEKHGIKAHPHPVGSDRKASEEILAYADKMHPSLIVIGAFGHKGIQYLFTGSCAKSLLKYSNYPFFLYH